MNRNQGRKKIEISLQGFALFAENKPENVKFYYHGGVVDQGVNVLKLSTRYGITERLIVTNIEQGAQRIPVEHLNMIYNGCDVGLNTSLGEGWGLTSIEHAVIGAPQVVPAHSACLELFSDVGITMGINQRVLLENVGTTGGLVRPEEVAGALQTLYMDKKLYNYLSKAGMEKFSSEYYSWPNIAKQWDKLFMKVMHDNNNISK
jgi:D-inositol-3-phosphate glycosyltransferase